MLYAVAGVAYRTEGGPFVRWLGPGPDGAPALRFHLGGTRPGLGAIAELDRAEDLLLGRDRPLGRPSLVERGYWRVVVERAEQLKASQPHLTWQAVADRVDTAERTLRSWRQLARHERDAGPGALG